MSPELKTLLVGWAVATLIGLIRLRSPEQWADLAVSSPRLAGLVKVARGAGFDIHAVVEGLVLLVLGQRPVKPAKPLPSPATVFQWVAERRITPEQGSAWLVDGVEPVAANAPQDLPFTTPGGTVISKVEMTVSGQGQSPREIVRKALAVLGAKPRRDKTPAEAEANAAPLGLSAADPGVIEAFPRTVPAPAVPPPFREDRIRHLISLMAGGTALALDIGLKANLAGDWGMSINGVEQLADEAGRRLRANLPPMPAPKLVDIDAARAQRGEAPIAYACENFPPSAIDPALADGA